VATENVVVAPVAVVPHTRRKTGGLYVADAGRARLPGGNGDQGLAASGDDEAAQPRRRPWHRRRMPGVPAARCDDPAPGRELLALGIDDSELAVRARGDAGDLDLELSPPGLGCVPDGCRISGRRAGAGGGAGPSGRRCGRGGGRVDTERLHARGRSNGDGQSRCHRDQPPPEAVCHYLGDQLVQRRAGQRAGGVIHRGIQRHVGRDPPEQARQPGQPRQLLAAPRARRQVLFYLGALTRPDRGEQINAELVTDLRTVVATAKFRHSRCPAAPPGTGRDDSRPPRTAIVPMLASTSGPGERFTGQGERSMSRAGIPATRRVPRAWNQARGTSMPPAFSNGVRSWP
jgi:hypothetical protein